MRFNRKTTPDSARSAARKAMLSLAAATAVGGVFFGAPASASTIDWLGFFTSEWNSGPNWLGSRGPNNSDTAVFNPGDGGRNIQLTANGTASILLVNGTASAAGPFTFTSQNGAILTCGT